MRIWSIHPEYLDAKGLVALWRETLLAKHVLEGKTKGYKNHPQLDRFKALASALDGINCYLKEVHAEASKRGYNFDSSKFDAHVPKCQMEVTQGQMDFELEHLLKKLKIRDPKKYKEVSGLSMIKPHPLFVVKEGGVEAWERV